ncbi:DUF4136 domain-containing protein [Pedobacter nyackensis]|uniref:DUF4136 domain-containing protein n=1 Tax=Pedobacter nyackensis TaxID=475255 RepID=A0A1W2E2F8_9SPHI|nr:hypothetical protein [Pedobacter nyackensis]SMD03258.1 hypothetical protein SAMN04488101_10960 [Pedobacter nyackensis]
MKKLKLLAILLVCGMAWSCSPITRVTGSWVDSAVRGKSLTGQTIFIASLTKNMKVRTELEKGFSDLAGQRNIKTVKGTDYFNPEFYKKLPTESQLSAQIKNSGANYVLTISLINKNSDTRYVPGTNSYAPYPHYRWYGGFYSYYNYWYPMFYEPGYYVTDKTYFMETNLYDLQGNKLIWSAQSETVNPGSIDNFVRTYPKVLVDQLIKDGLFPAQ